MSVIDVQFQYQQQQRMEEYAYLKEENFQLKNEITQLKNAFDLNRNILQIISEEIKSQNPRIKMLFQIIKRLTNVNNQIMITAAELIQEKNRHKFQKQKLKRQNEILIERLKQILENQGINCQSNKINQLSVYFKNKVNSMEEELKSLEEERIVKEHQMQVLIKKLQVPQSLQKFYEGEQKKLSIIPTIDKNNPKKLILSPPKNLLTPLQHARRHQSNRQTNLQMKLEIMDKQMRKIKLYCEQLEYRLIILIKVLQLNSEIKKKESAKNKYRKNLQQYYPQQVIEIKLLKFALNNLQTEYQGSDFMFSFTNRNFNNYKSKANRQKMKDRYLCKSVEKDNKIQMKPKFIKNYSEQSQQY